MICDQCETVAHCLKNGCVPKQPTKDEALKLALAALDEAIKLWREEMEYRSCIDVADSWEKTSTTIKQALADSALDRMAENARELGLDYEPVQEPVAWMTQARNFVHLCEFTEEEAKLYGWSAVYTAPPAQRKPLPKDEWPKHPSPYWNGEHLGFSKSDLTDYAMQVLAVHGVKENT